MLESFQTCMSRTLLFPERNENGMEKQIFWKENNERLEITTKYFSSVAGSNVDKFLWGSEPKINTLEVYLLHF